MTVAELKAILDKLPEDASVWINASPNYLTPLGDVKFNETYKQVNLK